SIALSPAFRNLPSRWRRITSCSRRWSSTTSSRSKAMAEPASTLGMGFVAKAIGSMIGSGLALTVLAPEHHRDAVVRAIVGVLFGFVFAGAGYHVLAQYVGDWGRR